MGNQQSGEGGTSTAKNMGRFMRSTGLLGLSKAELDERCKPSGLYPSCNWEDKAIRKLVGDGKLAPRLRGTENRSSPTDRECPICFLQYREVNTTKCCSAYICTECYLQVKPQKVKSHACPFCNHNKMSVTVAQTMNAEAMLAREETEQRFIEAKIRERAHLAEAAEAASNSQPRATPDGFGSSLQKDERIATLRARSSSLSDQENAESIPEDVLRESFAMTPEERRMLEDEMRAQHSHPLALRVEAEAEERRLRNEQEFLRQNPMHAIEAAQGRNSSRSRRSNRGGSERRNWNQIVEAFERGGHGEVNTLDDLVVLEAAMILSMEEESRRRAAGTDNSNSGGAASSSSAAGGGGGEGDFDANRHANEGFPLVRSILSGQGQSAEQSEQLQMLANSLSSRRRSRNSFLRATGGGGGVPDNNNMASAMDTAGLLMRGISEDDQMAMAIAASLQDQQQQPAEQENDGAGQESSTDNTNNTTTGEEAHEVPPAAATAAAEGVDGETTATAEEEENGEQAEMTPPAAVATVAPAETTTESEADSKPPAVESEAEDAGSKPPAVEEAKPATAEDPGSFPDSLDVTNHGEQDLN